MPFRRFRLGVPIRVALGRIGLAGIALGVAATSCTKASVTEVPASTPPGSSVPNGPVGPGRPAPSVPPAERRYDATATEIDLTVGHTVEVALRVFSCSRPDQWKAVDPLPTVATVVFATSEWDIPPDPDRGGGNGPGTHVFSITATTPGTGTVSFHIDRICPHPEPDVPGSPDDVTIQLRVTP